MTDEHLPVTSPASVGMLASQVSPPEVTEGRIARQWAQIEQRGLPVPVAPPTLSRWLVRAGFVFVPLALAAVVVFWGKAAAPLALQNGSSIESAQEPIALKLRDGSSVEMDAQSRLTLQRDQPDAVAIELGVGRARFDVTHVAGRKFTVAAGPAEVRVVGTRFSVSRVARPEGMLVQVSVTRGIVEVRRRDQGGAAVTRLFAGEDWSALVPNDATVNAPQPVAAAPSVEPAEPAEPAADVDSEDEDEADATEALDSSAPSTRHVSTASAPLIFRRANLARRAGQMREAASAYAELLRRHPRDARAGLSAFELGRIRMDALSDARGAVQAFERALRLSPSAGFREDALARIVVAHDALEQRAACLKARDRYLAAFPRGVHVVGLSARCGGS